MYTWRPSFGSCCGSTRYIVDSSSQVSGVGPYQDLMLGPSSGTGLHSFRCLARRFLFSETPDVAGRFSTLAQGGAVKTIAGIVLNKRTHTHMRAQIHMTYIYIHVDIHI